MSSIPPMMRWMKSEPCPAYSTSGIYLREPDLLIAQHNLAQAIEELKQANIWVIGLEGGVDAQPLGQVRLDGPLAVVVGSEGEGMRRLVRESCDVLMRLPMRGPVASPN